MSTRGIVAVGTKKRWAHGTYTHSDSYFSGLGKDLHDQANQIGLQALADRAKDNPGGFSYFADPSSAYEEERRDEGEGVTSANRDPSDWLYWEYLYIIDLDAGKIWGGHHQYESLSNVSSPRDFGPGRTNSAGPPKKFYEIWPEFKAPTRD